MLITALKSRTTDSPALRARRGAGLLVLLPALLMLAGAAQAQPAGIATAAEVRAALLHAFDADVVSSVHRAPRPAAVRPARAWNTPSPDRWLGTDKLYHATFSFLWTVGFQYTLVNKGDWTERRALPLSAGGAALLGLSKEVYDERQAPRNRFSPRDLAADALGIGLAVGLILL